jgi:RAB protein geranylgeranyltransferase component A
MTFAKVFQYFLPLNFYQTSRFVWLTDLYFFCNHDNVNYLISSITIQFVDKVPFQSQQKIFALTHRRVYTLTTNLFQILNHFVMLFRKNVIEKSFINWRVLPLVKINTRISDTPCITGKVVHKHN